MGIIKHNKHGYYINAVVFSHSDDGVKLGKEVFQIYLQEISTIASNEPYHIINLKDEISDEFFGDSDDYLLHFDGSVNTVIKELDILGIEYKTKYIDEEHSMIFDTKEEVERINKYIKDLHKCETYIYFE